MRTGWDRVSHREPCPICKKPDWCAIGEKGVNCMRIESQHSLNNGGWFHPFDANTERCVQYAKKKEPKVQVHPQFDAVLKKWKVPIKNGDIARLAEELCVHEVSLMDLGTLYAIDHKAFSFPMFNPSGKVIGIRLRRDKKKWAIYGSKAGLFIPWPATARLSTETVFICEGPTDTAAALTLGYFAIGRPACLGQEGMVLEVLKQLPVKEVVIVYDNDGPGVRGADQLAKALRQYTITKLVPPTKDLRSFIANGGTKDMLTSILKDCVRIRK